ncbi:Acetoacetyl-CoA synthetase [Pseudomonas sp. R4-39-08]|nr:Acetoacetyl-CoA synthetase [Pseudomonas sp. R4-39-08]
MLAETIGQAFDRTVARYPEGEAGGASSALPLHLAATGRDRGSACPCVRLHHPRHYHDLPNDGFDPLLTLTAVAEERATGLYGVPTMFIALLDHPRLGEFDLSSLRTGIMAGSTCPIDRSHALRGNAAPDALRHLSAVAETCSGWRDAERHRRHSHAERGNDQPESTKGTRRSPLICRCVLFFYY